MAKAPVPFMIIFLLALFCGWTAVSGHSVLREAERLAAAGAYEEAVTEYKRYLFFNADSPATPVYRAIAGMYRDKGQLADAQEALQRALAAADSDSLRDAVRIESAVLDLAKGAYQAAQMELVRLTSFSGSAVLRDRAGLFLRISYVMTGEWEKAKKVGSTEAISGPAYGRLRLLDSLLGTIPEFSRKSPVTAKWLSTFVPGLGQAYAKDLSDGLNALAISGLTGFMTVHSIVYGYYHEAVFTDITLFWRYYSGNRVHAAQAAERYNETKDRVIRKRIMEDFTRSE